MSAPGGCVFCERPIDVTRDYRKVSGWERGHRPAGGTNAIRMPERSDTWACRGCVDRLGRGIAPEQTSLV